MRPDTLRTPESAGRVAVPPEIAEFLSPEDINRTVEHLRFGGGTCWYCNKPIPWEEDVSFLVDVTAAGGRLGFAHFTCIPPQVIDRRRNRRSAIAMGRYLEAACTDAMATSLARNHMEPHAVLVISSSTPARAFSDEGESASPWLNMVISAGFEIVGCDSLSATPHLLPDWSVDVDGERLTCGKDERYLFDGEIAPPEEWTDLVTREGECLVLATGLGLDSNELGSAFESALDALAAEGMVVGARVTAGRIGKRR